MNQIQAILWVQWRTMRNLFPRVGIAWSVILGVGWYGLWTLGAIAFARALADTTDPLTTAAILPGGLLLALLYWQVVPLLLAASGASLDLRKLLAYPIPTGQFFTLEVLLRATGALEMVLMMAGLAVGLIFNPRLPLWGVLSVAVFVAFNLFLAAGIRDLVQRILARKGVREVAFFLIILLGAVPQFLVRRAASGSSQPGARMRAVATLWTWPGWPWTAAANVMMGVRPIRSAAILLAWCLAVGAFSRWQFSRTLRFDADAAGAGRELSSSGRGSLEWFYGWPSALFRDPLAALIEKEIRFLSRAPRFRLVFLMGFTFGFIIWLPMILGRNGSRLDIVGGNGLTVVSLYSMLLLGEVCFWNSFGFDRSAAQIYFLAPLHFGRVLLAKNIAALFFLLIEVGMVAVVAVLLRVTPGWLSVVEAFAVAPVASLLLMSAGNMVSVRRARAADPSKSLRAGGSTAARGQALLLFVYPVAFFPIALAYIARYAFDSEAAFFGVLLIDTLLGLIVYKLSMDSAVETANRLKEKMVAALSEGVGPIAA